MLSIRRVAFSVLVVVGVSGLANACAAPASELVAASDDPLINGTLPASDAFPATLHILGNCTATKVGEHLILTAAHCVRTPSGDIAPGFAPGTLQTLVVRGAVPLTRTALVKKTSIHPRIAAYCATRGCGNNAARERRDAPDVALIEVASGLEDVATAAIDVAPAAIDDAVSVVGYGCTVDTTHFSDELLRSGDTRLVDADAAVHANGLAASESLTPVRSNYLLTLGPTDALSSTPRLVPGLCPGDSGGSLYRAGTDAVIGINASYTFLSGGHVPVTNWYARVDGASPWGVAAWLEAKGARMTRSCAAFGCMPVRSDALTDAGADADASPDASHPLSARADGNGRTPALRLTLR